MRSIAETIGVSPEYYNDIEKNRRYLPDWKISDKLIDALSLSEAETVLFYIIQKHGPKM